MCCASALTAGSFIAADLYAVKTKVALLASSYVFFKLLRSKKYQPNLIFTWLLIGPINVTFGASALADGQNVLLVSLCFGFLKGCLVQ